VAHPRVRRMAVPTAAPASTEAQPAAGPLARATTRLRVGTTQAPRDLRMAAPARVQPTAALMAGPALGTQGAATLARVGRGLRTAARQ